MESNKKEGLKVDQLIKTSNQAIRDMIKSKTIEPDTASAEPPPVLHGGHHRPHRKSRNMLNRERINLTKTARLAIL
jgi:hypothetical protein